MIEKLIVLNVNGRDYQVSVPIDWSLVRVLREKLGLTGTKESCGSGDCGACTVIVDGKAVHSCIIPAMDAQGCKILTIEGISNGSELHFVQRAFMKTGAIQCGFCTPGMVMAVVALYMHNDDPSEEEVKKAISGNLCRCTGYKKIIDVAEEIKKERSGAAEPAPKRQIGTRHLRKDSFAKVTGRAKYINDFSMENMLYGAVLRSKVAFGRIISVDVSKARTLPGVEAVVCAADVGSGRFGTDILDQQIFCTDYVRFMGDPLAAVAAVDPETAEAALKLIEVEIEELQPNLDAYESMRKDAPVIHEGYDQYDKNCTLISDGPDAPNNVCFHTRVHQGDVEAAFAKADIIVEDQYTAHRTHPGYIEPHGALAYMDEHDHLNLISSTQKPYFFRTILAAALGIPQSKLKVKAPTVGGGFGGKLQPVSELYCAVLAMKTGKPVKSIVSREEELQAATGRHKIYYTLKTGVMKDGTIVARQIKCIADGGAYTLDSPGDLSLIVHSTVGPYRYQNLEVDAYCIYTNTVPAASNRAPGAPQSVFAIEAHTDVVARKLNMDPLEFRLKNILRNGEKGYNGQAVNNDALEDCLLKVAERLEWKKGNSVDGYGKGIACMWWCSGNFPGSAMVAVNDDGSVQILTGCNETGTGSKVTAIPQIAAEVLGVDYDEIVITDSDTDKFSYDHGVGASRMTHSIGKAVLLCCEQIKDKFEDFLKEEGLAKDETIKFTDGKVIIGSDKKREIPLGLLAKKYKSKYGPIVGQASLNIPFPNYDPSGLEGFAYPAYPGLTFCVHGAIARRDEETGMIEVKKMVSAQDVGFAINPTAIESTMEGGLVMGLSYAMTEERVMEKGEVLNKSFHDYKILTALDVPELETIILEYADKEALGPMGAKGVAENALAPAAGAVANAIYAVSGIKVGDSRLQNFR